jgi:hypothetical protein
MHVRTRLFASCCLAAAASGCGALGGALPGVLGGGDANKVPNPMTAESGPLTWSGKPERVPSEGEKACTTWPIESELQVTASPETICATGKVFTVVESWAPAPEETTLDVQTIKAMEIYATVIGDSLEKISAPATKLGTCSANGSDVVVWAATFTNACVPNKGASGQALTASTVGLRVGPAKWAFGGGAEGAPSAPSAAKSP